MTKSELVDAIAADAKISKSAAGAALDSFIKNVTKALKSKDGKVDELVKSQNSDGKVKSSSSRCRES